MEGYIYKTTNLLTGEFYIGKHKSKNYDANYYRSGKYITSDISKFGKNNFSNEILITTENAEDLDNFEKYVIEAYRYIYPDKMTYNIADGGLGGDTFSRKNEKDKKEFIDRMTDINRQRCGSEEFKKKKSEYMTKKYKDPIERQKQADNMNAYWNKSGTREAQSIKLKRYYADHPEYIDYLNTYKIKPCGLEFNNTYKEFDSITELREYMSKELQYTPDNRTIKKMFSEGKNGEGKKFFHKRFKHLDGLKIYPIDK